MDTKRTFDILNDSTAARFPSRAEIEHHVARAQRLRSEATTQMFLQAGRGVARMGRTAAAALASWHRQRQTRDALTRCSDRVLADVGIEREHIPLVARGIDPAGHQPRTVAIKRWWQAGRERLDAARQARQERHQVYRELMAYSDRDLEEIGLRRADVPMIARGHPVLQRAA